MSATITSENLFIAWIAALVGGKPCGGERARSSVLPQMGLISPHLCIPTARKLP